MLNQKQLKIALFSDYFTDEECIGGGVGTVVTNLASKISKKGYIVYVHTVSVNGEQIKYGKRLIIFKYSSILRVCGTYLSLNLLIKPLKHDVDIVHIEGGIIASLAGLLYSILKRKPLIVTIHQMEKAYRTFKNPLKRLLISLYDKTFFEIMLSKADKIIVLSKCFLFSNRLFKFRDKIVVIPNGIDIDTTVLPVSKDEALKRLKMSTNNKIVLFIGTLCRRKGVHLLIEASKRVIKNFPNSIFIFVGGESDEIKISKIIKNLNDLRTHVYFTGYVSDFTKKLYYKIADLFVLPSLAEAFPLVLLEAAANGLPIIVSDIPVFKTLIKDGLNGLIVRNNDINDLAEKILILLKDSDLRESLGRNAKKMVTNFSWDNVAEKHIQLYINVIKKHASFIQE